MAQPVEVQKGMKEKYRERHTSKPTGPGSGGRMGQGLEVNRNHSRTLTREQLHQTGGIWVILAGVGTAGQKGAMPGTRAQADQW